METRGFVIVGDPDDMVVSQCVWCAHRNDDGRSCGAFPDGIPSEILLNKHDHLAPYPGDDGTLYEPVELVLDEREGAA